MDKPNFPSLAQAGHERNYESIRRELHALTVAHLRYLHMTVKIAPQVGKMMKAVSSVHRIPAEAEAAKQSEEDPVLKKIMGKIRQELSVHPEVHAAPRSIERASTIAMIQYLRMLIGHSPALQKFLQTSALDNGREWETADLNAIAEELIADPLGFDALCRINRHIAEEKEYHLPGKLPVLREMYEAGQREMMFPPPRPTVDVSGTPHDSALQYFHVMEALQKHAYRRKLPENSFDISTERVRRPLGTRALLSTQPDDFGKVHSLKSGNRWKLLDTLTKSRDRMYSCLGRQVGLVNMTYLLHAYETDDQKKLLEGIRRHCGKAACVITDYTLLGIPDATALGLLNSHFEEEVRGELSKEEFLREHQVFTLGRMQDVVRSSGWKHALGVPLKAGRGLVVGTDEDPDGEMAQDLEEALHHAAQE